MGIQGKTLDFGQDWGMKSVLKVNRIAEGCDAFQGSNGQKMLETINGRSWASGREGFKIA